MRRIVRDDPERPDPGYAELFASLDDAADPEPWLGWCRAAGGPALYLGVGTGRLAVPLTAAGIELVNPHWLAAGAGEGVRVLRADRRRAELEIGYPGGWRQRAAVRLRWPEETERYLAGAGLRLEQLRGADPDATLAQSPSYLVLARRRRPAARPAGRPAGQAGGGVRWRSAGRPRPRAG